jgi:hypothetical protein
MASKRDRAARIAELERLIKPRRRGGRTIADEDAEHGFTQAEMERAGRWWELVRREPLYGPRTLDERQAWQAAEGARWLHCRLQHGPGLCEVDCPGEFRHRPDWKPR